MAKDVLTVVATKNASAVSFSGTTEDGVLAVSCSLKDSAGAEIDFNSVMVSGNRFSGDFSSNIANAKTVVCANYDSGRLVSATITEESSTTGNAGTSTSTSTTSAGTPGTGVLTDVHEGSAVFTTAFGVVLAVMAVLGFVVAKIVKRKTKNLK